MEEDNSPHLPEEIWSSIFLRAKVSAKFLGQCMCMCMCKSWSHLIGDSAFIRLYNESGVCRPDILVLESEKIGSQWRGISLFCTETKQIVSRIQLPAPYKHSNFSIIGSCNGLYCICLENDSQGLALWNPCVGKLRKLPYVKYRRAQAIGFGYAASDYKLVKLQPHCPLGYVRSYDVKLYSFRENSWRILPSSYPLNGPSIVHFHQTFGTYCNTALYWLCNRIGDNSSLHLLRFDVERETFTVLSLHESIPELIKTCVLGDNIGVCENSLSLFHKIDEGGFVFCDIWVKDQIDDSWGSNQHFQHSTLLRPVPLNLAWPLSGTDRRFHVVLNDIKGPVSHLVLYDLMTRSFEDSGIVIRDYQYIGEYRESLMFLV